MTHAMDDEAVLALRGLARGPARWIWDRWPALSEARRMGGRPDWQHLAAVMAKARVRTKTGKGPKAETVRQAYRRVAKVVQEHGHPGLGPPVSPPARVKPGTPVVRWIIPTAAEDHPEPAAPIKPHWTDP